MRFKAKLLETALNHLETSEMVAMTGGWLGDDRPLLESLDKTSPFLPDVEKVHRALSQVRPKEKIDARVAAISAEQSMVDQLHDHALRALFYAHEALIEYSLAKEPVDEDRVELLRHSQERLMMDGLAGAQVTYEVEAGNAERAQKLAETDEEIQKALSAIFVSKNVDGHRMLNLWVSHGATLGELSRDKSNAIAKAGSLAAPDQREAREEWVDVVLTMLKALSRIEDPTGAVKDLQRRVLETTDRARKRETEARKARQAASATQPPADEEKPPET